MDILHEFAMGEWLQLTSEGNLIWVCIFSLRPQKQGMCATVRLFKRVAYTVLFLYHKPNTEYRIVRIISP